MKIGLLNWKWVFISVIVSVPAHADVLSKTVVAAQNSLEKTRLQLQQQGFKTELTNFDFSTSAELRDREAILESTTPNRGSAKYIDNPPEHPDLMEPSVSNKVVVVWEQDSVRRQTASWPDLRYDDTWHDFDEAINEKRSQIDDACIAILSGPIAFDLVASNGSYMLLRHLPLVKDLTQTLNDRTMIALHEGNRDMAWTNLMAATRLVTEWNPEPVEISHRVRFGIAELVFKATWQALQTNGWTDDQLANLQHEWEMADFLSRLPDTVAFRRACDFKSLETDKPAAQTPAGGTYEDEQRLLLFYRDREIEYRNAVQAASWEQMRSMPGVTNEIDFQPEYHYRRFGFSLQNRRTIAAASGQRLTVLALSAEAEAERRILITALALKRYHAKYKRFPETLRALSPEFLKSVPADFINGQPLHYRVTEDRHFLLYSVGLDCADNDGKIQAQTVEDRLARVTNTTENATAPESDIVWPLAASSAEVVALRKHQTQVIAEFMAQRKAEAEVQEKASQQEQQELRSAAMKKLLASKPSLGPEPVYNGVPLSSWVDKIGKIEEYNGTPEDAVTAIRAIGSKAVPFLLEWMPHPGAERPVDGYPNDTEFAWWALGAEGKGAIPELARMISRPQHSPDDYSVWTESAKAISYLGPDAIIPMLTAATNLQGKHDLWELLHNFGNLGTNGAPAVPALIHWANDPDHWVRDGVVSALGGIGKRPDLAVPVLINALEHDPNGMVRRDAASSLGVFAHDSDAILPELTRMLKDPDWQAREGALSGLSAFHEKADAVIPLVTPFLYDNNNVIQRSAAYALLGLGSQAGYRALVQASNAPSSWPGIGDIIYQAQEKMHGDKSPQTN